MARITVYRPDVPDTVPADAVPMARRGLLPDAAVLTIVENGKPNARRLLRFVAGTLRDRLPFGTVDVVSKPSAAKPIDADEATVMAARSHLVITGVGD